MKLSVIIPCFNEVRTIEKVISAVRDSPYTDLEIIVVDDASTDGTRERLRELEPIVDKVIYHPVNQGKGAAIQSGLRVAAGDMVVIQDADLEYDPQEYAKLVKPIVDGKADVVYGSRFIGDQPHRVLFFWHRVGNGLLTFISNMFTNLNLTDMETGYKVFRREVLESVVLEETRFGFEPEVTSKIARLRCPIYEVGISYYGRTYDEGKKVGWKDGVRALYCILKYNLPMRLLRYVAVGGTAALIDLAFFFLFAKLLGLHYLAVAGAGFVLATLVNYQLGIRHVFRSEARFSKRKEFLLVYAVSAVGLGINQTVLFAMVDLLGAELMLSKATATGLVFLWNYGLRSRVVFRERPEALAVARTPGASRAGS